MTTSPDETEPRQLSGEDQNAITKEDSSLHARIEEKGHINSGDVPVARAEPQLESDAKILNGTGIGSSMMSQNAESSIHTVQSKCESKDDKNYRRTSESSSTGGQDLETSSKKEEKDQIKEKSTEQDDDTKNALHSREFAVKEKNELHLQDLPKDSGLEDVSIRDVEDVESNANGDKNKELSICFVDDGHYGGVDVTVNSADANDFDTTSSERKDLDLPSNIINQSTEKPPIQPGQNDFDTKAYLENQKYEERRDQFETKGEGEKTLKKLSDEESSGSNAILPEPISTIRPTESLRAKVNSMEEISNSFADLKHVPSPESESKVESSIDFIRRESTTDVPKSENPSIETRRYAPDLGLATEGENLCKNIEVEAGISYNPSNSIYQITMQSERSGEQKLKDSSVGNDHHSQPKSYKHRDENDSISSTHNSFMNHDPEFDDGVEPSSKQLPSEKMQTFPATNSEKFVAKNDGFQLDNLEALLQFNPSSKKPSATLSTNGSRDQELLGSTPSRIQLNTTLDNQISDEKIKIQADTKQNSKCKDLENTSFGCSTPSRIQSSTTLDDHIPDENNDTKAGSEQNSELKCLEDLLTGCTSSKIQSNSSLDDQIPNKNDEIQADSERNSELKLFEDLMSGYIPSTTQLNTTSDDIVRDEINKIQADTEKLSSLQSSNAESLLAEKMLPNTNRSIDLSEEAHPSVSLNLHGDYVASKNDSTLFSSDRNRSASTDIVRQDKEQFSEEGQLSVFSDATSGQDYLRNVSNAKKQLKKIEDEMKELKGITENFESRIVDNIKSNHCTDNKSEVSPFETNHSIKGVQSQIPKGKKSAAQKERGIEPLTRKQEAFDQSSSSDEKKKTSRKSAKKKQVRPEKGKRKVPMDPNGKHTPTSQKYDQREMKRDMSPSSSKRRMARDKPTTPTKVKKTDQNRNRSDPPMVVKGSLEVEGSPTYWNGDHLSIEKKTKRNKRREENKNRDGNESRNRADDHSKYKGTFQEDNEMNMNSVVSSRMDRGDEGWSIPIDEVNADNVMSEGSYLEEDDEINGVPRHVDTRKPSDYQQQYDPWEEVPCSCCCRYLPHKLVVATTHAYRLDRADEKDNKRMES